MSPPRPLVAAPVPTVTAPVLPSVVVPVPTATSPLLPSFPALAVSRITDPLVEPVL